MHMHAVTSRRRPVLKAVGHAYVHLRKAPRPLQPLHPCWVELHVRTHCSEFHADRSTAVEATNRRPAHVLNSFHALIQLAIQEVDNHTPVLPTWTSKFSLHRIIGIPEVTINQQQKAFSTFWTFISKQPRDFSSNRETSPNRSLKAISRLLET